MQNVSPLSPPTSQPLACNFPSAHQTHKPLLVFCFTATARDTMVSGDVGVIQEDMLELEIESGEEEQVVATSGCVRMVMWLTFYSVRHMKVTDDIQICYMI